MAKKIVLLRFNVRTDQKAKEKFEYIPKSFLPEFLDIEFIQDDDGTMWPIGGISRQVLDRVIDMIPQMTFESIELQDVLVEGSEDATD